MLYQKVSLSLVKKTVGVDTALGCMVKDAMANITKQRRKIGFIANW